MTVLLGLGNPGGAYARTRHNAGFLAIDRLAGELGAAWRPDASGLFDEALGYVPAMGAPGAVAEEVLLARPSTFMNRSGAAAATIAGARALPPGRFLLIHDDIALPLGWIRVRAGGSSGGHKGVESVIEALGTQDVPRLRLGIGAPAPAPGEAPAREIRQFVLEEFEPAEGPAVEAMIARACEAARTAVTMGLDRAASLYNGAGAQPCPGN